MHECPVCGFECDCDGEDLFQPAPARCTCECLDMLQDDDEPWDDDANEWWDVDTEREQEPPT